MLIGTYVAKLWRARLALNLGAEGAKMLFRGYPDESLVSVPPGETYGSAERQGLDDLGTLVAEARWLGDDEGGSNAWVVAGSRTASGLPLVAGDSHRALDLPTSTTKCTLTVRRSGAAAMRSPACRACPTSATPSTSPGG